MNATLFLTALVLTPAQLDYTIGDNRPQRSRIEQVTIEFPGEINLKASNQAAVQIERVGVGNVARDLSWSIGGGKSIVTITFPAQPAVYARSLVDGNYKIHVNGDQLQYVGGATVSGQHVEPFHRFFGDFDGDRDVDNLDMSWFVAAYGSLWGMAEYEPAFDYDGDGDVDNTDWAQFVFRFGQTLEP